MRRAPTVAARRMVRWSIAALRPVFVPADAAGAEGGTRCEPRPPREVLRRGPGRSGPGRER
eukprot:4409472-Lingulodinium_polyedra.AAC.1